MKEINAYLTFNGNCREAMTFYKESLGGDLNIMTFEESKMDVPQSEKQKVLHSTLISGKAKLMASDSMNDRPVNNGSSISISVDCESLEEIEKFFKNMSKGANVTMPLQDTFWGARFRYVNR